MRTKPRILQTAACAAVCLLLLFGCGTEKRSLLWYQENMSSVTLESDGYLFRIVPERDGYRCTLLSPESVSGISFFCGEGTAYAEYGNLHIPIRAGTVGGMERMLPCLSLQEENLLHIEADRETGLVHARFRMENAICTVGMASDSLPIFFLVESGEETIRYAVQTWETAGESR